MNSTSFILKAAQFSALKHRDQRRKDSESSPYVIHPIFVALTLADIGDVEDPEILAAALLHDTLEDTDATASELEEIFGSKVRSYVEEVTDDKSLAKEERKKKQIEHAASLSKGAALIKLGDKISNVSDVTNSPPLGWPPERRIKYLDWAEAVINNCPEVNESLKNHFFKVVELGRQVLLKN